MTSSHSVRAMNSIYEESAQSSKGWNAFKPQRKQLAQANSLSMSGLLEKLHVTKSEGMGGIGSDQGALQTSDSPSLNPSMAGTQEQSEPGVGSGEGKDLDRGPNNFGGPTFGRASKTSRHESEMLNKLDPRIGYDGDDVHEQVLDKYEGEYGKAQEYPDIQPPSGRDMAGIGADQSALRENPTFRQQEEDAIARQP